MTSPFLVCLCVFRLQLKIPSEGIATQIVHMKNLEEKLSGCFTGIHTCICVYPPLGSPCFIITLLCHTFGALSFFWEAILGARNVDEGTVKHPFPIM